ncbi:MAG: hypothetical protein ACLGPL_02380 [Acidobacteriota bacterium]
MEHGNSLIQDEKYVLKILQYCKHNAVPLTAKCDELISIDLKLNLTAIRPLAIEDGPVIDGPRKKENCLITKLHRSSFNLDLPWPSRVFTFSFQYRTINHSFHSQLIRFIRRTSMAVFSVPRGIYEHRLREHVRVQLASSDDVTVRIGPHTLEAMNLTIDGIGLCASDYVPLRTGQRIPDLTVSIHGRQFRAEGTVRHATSKDGNRFFYGMAINYLDGRALSALREIIVEKQMSMAGVGLSGKSD